MEEPENQAPPLVDYNPFDIDSALRESLHREGGGWAEDSVRALGARIGSEEVIGWGVAANANPPVLRTHDRFGRRLDVVELHPAWHSLMSLSIGAGLHASPWREPRAGAHVARAAAYAVAAQNELGHCCPVTMTYAVVPALRAEPELAREWEPRVTSLAYDGRFRPAAEKTGALMGMAMTEKQGGSDVRANITRAVPAGDGGWLLSGHKWFCSAPMCDAFLMLAQAPRGLTCFLVPRFLPDGTKNKIFIQRLKDKLGNRSNASSEIELGGAWGRMVGEEGRGVATILVMVNHTRLDCVIGSAGMIRQALTQALHHTAHRAAFGRLLARQPLMQNVLADLVVESEAATLLMMRLARAYDEEHGGPFRRIATAVAKYWVCKRAGIAVGEALECLGGNGYVEDSGLPRIYRECPLNSIWEGSGNVICLDVLRTIRREPRSLEAFIDELQAARGRDARLDAYLGRLAGELAAGADVEPGARRLVERMALALQATLLVEGGHPAVAEAFLRSRLGGEWGHVFGTLPDGLDLPAIIERGSGRHT